MNESLDFAKVVKDCTGGNAKIKQSNYLPKGALPVVDQGQAPIAGYIDAESMKYKGTLPCVIFGDHTCILKYVDFDFVLGADGTKILVPDSDEINAKYLYYFLNTVHIPDRGYSRHFKYLKRCKIPVVSLSEQKQIIQTLDTADTLRQKRKEQLNLLDDYLKSVFFEMFGDPVANQKKWEKKKLVKLCDIKGGGTPSKSNPAFFKGNIPWVSPKDMKQFFINDSIDKITEEAIEQSSAKLLPERCVLMVVRSGILKNKLPVAINRVPVAVNQDMKAFVVNDEINPEFLIHWFISQERNILQTVRGTTADNISSEVIKKLEIIVPDSKLQNKFASIVKQVEQTKQKMRASLDEMDNHFNALMQRYFG